MAALTPREEKAKLIEHMLDGVEAELSERNHSNSFIESLREQFDDRGFLTEKQIEALRKFYERV